MCSHYRHSVTILCPRSLALLTPCCIARTTAYSLSSVAGVVHVRVLGRSGEWIAERSGDGMFDHGLADSEVCTNAQKHVFHLFLHLFLLIHVLSSTLSLTAVPVFFAI